MNITVERNKNGTLLSTIHKGEYHKRQYVLWEGTLAEMKKDFREFVREACKTSLSCAKRKA